MAAASIFFMVYLHPGTIIRKLTLKMRIGDVIPWSVPSAGFARGKGIILGCRNIHTRQKQLVRLTNTQMTCKK